MTHPASPYQPDRSLKAKLMRRIVQWRAVRPLAALPSGPLVSVTFDDFPKSAAEKGAAIVEANGGRATFYACSGLANTTGHMGEMYTQDHLARLSAAGHEIGAHGHKHIDYARSSARVVVDDLIENLRRLSQYVPEINSLAFPYGETRMSIKRAVGEVFLNARGILPGLVRPGADTLQLRATELTPDDATLNRAEHLIDQCLREKGWLILFTHDVANAPSPFGVSPQTLDMLLRRATLGGARLVPVSQAMQPT